MFEKFTDEALRKRLLEGGHPKPDKYLVENTRIFLEHGCVIVQNSKTGKTVATTIGAPLMLTLAGVGIS